MAYDFYWISGSPNAWRAMLALELKNLDYTSHHLDPGKQEHKAPEIMALNPRGKVPILKDGDFVVHESIAIMAYLERQHPEPPLFGTTPAQTGLIWQRIFEVLNYALDPIDDRVLRPLYRGQAATAGDAIKAGAVAAHAALQWAHDVLSGTPYLAGDELSAADVSFMPNIQGLRRAGAREDAVKLQLGFDNFADRYPAITTWLGRIEALAAYDKVYPPHWRDG